MARSADEVAIDLALSIEQTDPSWDTDQGPIPDLFIRPIAGQISLAETAAEELRLLFSLQFPDVATEEEIRNALRNYGSEPGIGEKSSHIQYFFRFTKPTSDITIPVGTLVSNSSGDLIYKTLNAIIMSSESDALFNADRGTFEVSTRVEAVGFGEEYNLPSYRVESILTEVIGIEGTENRSKSSGGSEEESTDSQSDRLKESLLGINLNSPGGIKNRIQNSFPERVSDVNTVKTSDEEFVRIIDKPSLDIYLIGTEPETFRENFEASGGQTDIITEKVPVLDVVSVTINGSGVDFELITDYSKETQKSLDSIDIIKVAPMLNTDQVEIEYNYNKLLEDVNDQALDQGQEFLFEVDYLLRSPVIIPPVIELEIKTLPSYDFETVQNNVLEKLESIFSFDTFQEIKTPREVQDDIEGSVSGIRDFKWVVFRRSSGSLSDIEQIIYNKNEISDYDSSLIDVRSVR